MCDERRLPVFHLLKYKEALLQTLSFSANVFRVNFTHRCGWGGKLYVETDGHGVDEYKPVLRGVELLNMHYLEYGDMVILTEEQYKDYLAMKDIFA